MRRNSVTILKFILSVGVIVTGLTSLKLLFGDHKHVSILGDDEDAGNAPEALPVGPREGAPHRLGQTSDRKLEKIDWHNYTQIADDAKRQGPGEQGDPVTLDLTAEEKKLKRELYQANGFNAIVSDKISLQRALKDIRHPDCKSKKYWNKLPNCSIVVPFHNEHWTTLLRLVYSVNNRAPKGLLHEVILVDDFSTKSFLKDDLDNYMKENFDNVKVIHADKREGLIRTRLLGAKHATGEVLLFLDSHVEASINYLPPLLDPIADDYRTVVCPFIDVIDFSTFLYRAQDEGARGAFDWQFFYKRLPLLTEDLLHPAEPFKSPVMAGGLFAISRKWFWELGGYDPGLDIWGGEQYELSFKIWQCGGKMVDAPCSRIGHVYRDFPPFKDPGLGNFIGRNYRRVAEVWMDEYAEYLYKRSPHFRNIDPGDLTEQRAIRTRLKCKPFKWFMTEVAFDLPKFYPPIEPLPIASGQIRNEAAAVCVALMGQTLGLQKCVAEVNQGKQQRFEFTWKKDIRPWKISLCFDVPEYLKTRSPVKLYACHGAGGNQRFRYNYQTKQLLNEGIHQCLECDLDGKELFVNPCSVTKDSQKWLFTGVNQTAVEMDWAEL